MQPHVQQNQNNLLRPGPGPLPRGRILVSQKYEELRTLLTLFTIFLLPLVKILLMFLVTKSASAPANVTMPIECTSDDCEKIVGNGTKDQLNKPQLFPVVIRDAVVIGTIFCTAGGILASITYIIRSNQENVFRHMKKFSEVYYSLFQVQFSNYSMAIFLLQLSPTVHVFVFMVGMLELISLYFVRRSLKEQERLMAVLEQMYREHERLANIGG